MSTTKDDKEFMKTILKKVGAYLDILMNYRMRLRKSRLGRKLVCGKGSVRIVEILTGGAKC